MRLPLSLALLAPVALAAQQPAARRAMTFEDFAAVRVVNDPQLSPDGATLLYAVRSTDVEGNRRVSLTQRLPLAEGTPRPFPDDTTRATEARWSPDGRRVAYVAGGQLWVANADGSSPRRLTALNGGATGPVWSPAGDRLLFSSTVYPDCQTDACNAERERAAAANKVKARVADRLLYRHWDRWSDGTRSHLFVIGADGSGLRDLTAGLDYDVPVPPFGGSEGYAFSHDGQEVAYTAKQSAASEAWSTDLDVWVVPVGGGTAVELTKANAAADQNPVYSPDGRWIAYASQARAGFESDRWRLMLHDRRSRTSRELLPRWDRNADAFWFAGDSRAVFVMTTDRGRDKLYRAALDANGGATGAPALVIGDGNNLAFSFSRDTRTVAWVRDAADRPAEAHVATLDGARASDVRAVTHVNDALVATLRLHPLEEFWFRGAGGDSVQGWVLKPPQWESGRRFPAILLIHGGPQGAFLDNWHGRWNYQMFAATGSGVVIVNPRGSTGYGQRFVDGVSKDWAGKVHTDLMNGLDAALARHPWLDGSRVGAAGGSYGGYMTNWLNGHSTRFKALVTHAGVFNLEAMYGTTEELWFTEWEFGGPYWNPTANQEQYRRNSPHLAAGRMRTPTLVLHGELDYRVPYTEGLGLFTALQRRGVPSRLVVFPDEGHWIGRPQNQRLWWKEVQGWLAKYLATGTAS
jgi:dipeptidyl aminopeptidase/acylaminoacyl peptidase